MYVSALGLFKCDNVCVILNSSRSSKKACFSESSNRVNTILAHLSLVYPGFDMRGSTEEFFVSCAVVEVSNDGGKSIVGPVVDVMDPECPCVAFLNGTKFIQSTLITYSLLTHIRT